MFWLVKFGLVEFSRSFVLHGARPEPVTQHGIDREGTISARLTSGWEILALP